MDVFVIAEIDRHMAREKDQVALFQSIHRNLFHRITGFDGSVPVDQKAVVQIAHESEARTIDALG